jgi:hypothetical protein
MYPQYCSEREQGIRWQRLAAGQGKNSAILGNTTLVQRRSLEESGQVSNETFAECSLRALPEEVIGLANASGNAGIEGILRRIFTHLCAVLLHTFQAQSFEPVHAVYDFQAYHTIRSAETIEGKVQERWFAAVN